MSLPESALLIIDMQEGLFRGPASPHSAEAVLSNVCELIAKARQAHVPVFLPATPDLMIPILRAKSVNTTPV